MHNLPTIIIRNIYEFIEIIFILIFMDLVENFDDSGKFVSKLFLNIGNLLILVVLNIIPIVNLITIGYLGGIIREGKKLREPPIISNYGRLFIDGLKIVIAIIVYTFIPILLILFSGIISVSVSMSSPYRINMRNTIILTVSFALIILFVFLILGVMAIGNMIKSNNFMKIFSFRENWGLISKVGFLKYLAWLFFMFILALICLWVGGINWIIAALIGLLFGVFAARSLGHILDEAFEKFGSPSIYSI